MVNVQNINTIKELRRAAQIPNSEATPVRLAESMVPVIQTNIPIQPFRVITDIAVNDSSKDFVVPTGKIWKIHYGFVDMVTDVTAGSRQLGVRILNSAGNTLLAINDITVQTASLTESYNLIPGLNDGSETIAGLHLVVLPRETWLLEGWTFRILDAAGISPTGDDLLIRFLIEEHDV